MLSAWHTAAELVRKDLIKHFCSEKHQLIKIPTVFREELGLLRLLSGKNLWHVCTRTGECVCVCVRSCTSLVQKHAFGGKRWLFLSGKSWIDLNLDL